MGQFEKVCSINNLEENMSVKKEDCFEQAFNIWNSFKREVIYNNRFFAKHEILEFLRALSDKYKTVINKGTTLFRARIYSDDIDFLNYLNDNSNTEGCSEIEKLHMMFIKAVIEAKQKSGFWGYDELNSFAPKDNDIVGEGRVNPSYIRYLYTAESEYTALVEVRPYLGDIVSIAAIEVLEDISVIDFTVQNWNQKDDLEEYLIFLIMMDFSKPNKGDKKSYIPIQFISEYFKNLGFEGIRFNSSLHKYGKNITVFNIDKCKAINSKLYKVEEVCFESKCLAPKSHPSLIHPKLQPNLRQLKSIQEP